MVVMVMVFLKVVAVWQWLFLLVVNLTKVIFILRGPETDMSRPRIEPGPPWLEASILEKSHSNKLLIIIRNIHICARDENARDNGFIMMNMMVMLTVVTVVKMW